MLTNYDEINATNSMSDLISQHRVALASALLALFLINWHGVSYASNPGIKLPTPSGTTWSIIAGYNTATHISSDPNAIDIIREDGATAGTLVLAPIDGTISWVSQSCLTIEKITAIEILICHIFPNSGIQKGTSVLTGQPIATVAPAGQAENNGVSHIHLAIHRSKGAGQIQQTVPFSGAYMLEGIDLPDTTAPNAYAGILFTSSNTEVEINPLPASDLKNKKMSRQVTLLPGWNLVGWTSDANITDVINSISGKIGSVFRFNNSTQQFQRFDPKAPKFINTLTTLKTGDGLLINLTNPNPTQWLLPAIEHYDAIDLLPGFNLVTWSGNFVSVLEASTRLGESLVAIHSFDEISQKYRSFRPSGPSLLNDLSNLSTGQGLWVEVRNSVRWSMKNSTEQIPNIADPQEKAEPSSGLTGRILGPGCLNLRKIPTINANYPITCLAVGTIVELTGEETFDGEKRKWLEVKVGNLSGWVSAEFIAQEPTQAAPGLINGEATYYHPSLAGNIMYCGDVYDPNNVTIAAATSWACGTKLRVSRGERFVDVLIQDTGLLPAYHVDLSEAAFQQLGLLAEGRLTVTIEVLSMP